VQTYSPNHSRRDQIAVRRRLADACRTAFALFGRENLTWDTTWADLFPDDPPPVLATFYGRRHGSRLSDKPVEPAPLSSPEVVEKLSDNLEEIVKPAIATPSASATRHSALPMPVPAVATPSAPATLPLARSMPVDGVASVTAMVVCQATAAASVESQVPPAAAVAAAPEPESFTALGSRPKRDIPKKPVYRIKKA